jgi:hypothetical protein
MGEGPQKGPLGAAPVQPDAHLTRYEQVQDSVDKSLRYVDIAAAILLAIATVATAWCAYQSSRWSGVQATSFAQASTARIEANRNFSLAMAAINYDTVTFIEWLNARASGDGKLFSYVNDDLIREDFKPYLDEWLAASDYEELPTPLDDEDYVEELIAETISFETQAGQKFEQATEANQTSDDYVLATVLFASVLFFAGISNKFERLRIQGALVAMGGLLLIVGFIQIAGLPIE